MTRTQHHVNGVSAKCTLPKSNLEKASDKTQLRDFTPIPGPYCQCHEIQKTNSGTVPN